jgi:SAM-dependent methyltransferase
VNVDQVARYNKERWEELARAGVEYSRPFLDLDARSARALLDPHRIMGHVKRRDVLCLASGGGQQSVAFALLGAQVTVYDLSETQLQRDREAAQQYGVRLRAVQGDMRNLRRFADRSFDVVWQAHSINFVPEARPVLAEVARVSRPGALYRIECNNPFVAGLDERDWDGHAYPLSRPYVDGAEIEYADPYWEIRSEDGRYQRVKGPREFRHTLSTLVNGMAESGFVILGLWEEKAIDLDPEPGTWEHLKSVAPPWFTVWARHCPDVLTGTSLRGRR